MFGPFGIFYLGALQAPSDELNPAKQVLPGGIAPWHQSIRLDNTHPAQTPDRFMLSVFIRPPIRKDSYYWGRDARISLRARPLQKMVDRVGILHFWGTQGTNQWTQLCKTGISPEGKPPGTMRFQINNTNPTWTPGRLMLCGNLLKNWWSCFTEYQQPLGVTWCPL